MENENNIIKEVCVNDIAQAVRAQSLFADRIELCADLNEGGITPSLGVLKTCKELVKTPTIVMLRPRGGNFVYSDIEKKVLLEDAKTIHSLSFYGVAFGAITEDGEVDESLCKEILDILSTEENTFHMAFDHLNDPIKAIEVLAKLGFKRILSRGGLNKSAFDNYEMLLKYYEKSKQVSSSKDNTKSEASKIIILPGGGITNENLDEFNKLTDFKFKELHGTKIVGQL